MPDNFAERRRQSSEFGKAKVAKICEVKYWRGGYCKKESSRNVQSPLLESLVEYPPVYIWEETSRGWELPGRRESEQASELTQVPRIVHVPASHNGKVMGH